MEIIIESQKIFYTDEGRGEAVLLLHGWGVSSALFRPLIDLLKQNYRVLALDFPGFGQSPEPAAAWSVGDYTSCTVKFLRALNIEACTLLGHSFGGRVILKLFETPPEIAVQKIILVDAAGIKPPQSAKAKARAKRYQALKQLLRFSPKLLEWQRRRHGSADYLAASPRMREVLVKTVNEDLRHCLPRVAPPTLLIWGRNDDATPLSDAELMERELPDAGLVILENAGHFSFLEQQAQFLRVIASFMGV